MNFFKVGHTYCSIKKRFIIYSDNHVHSNGIQMLELMSDYYHAIKEKK